MIYGFKGKNIGRRIAKLWNMDLKRSFPFRCRDGRSCNAICGSEKELMAHYKNKHPAFYKYLLKKQEQTVIENTPPTQAEAAA